MIQIWQPRYHDRKVLVAEYKIPHGAGIDIEITQGAMKGQYHATHETIMASKLESMKCKSGGTIGVRAIPLDLLERKDSNNGN